eukprot:Amastigsp_a842679_8.p4 type:complete len:176 gc:universal Amastigsp_a842679_8:988-1515(+)
MRRLKRSCASSAAHRRSRSRSLRCGFTHASAMGSIFLRGGASKAIASCFGTRVSATCLTRSSACRTCRRRARRWLSLATTLWSATSTAPQSSTCGTGWRSRFIASTRRACGPSTRGSRAHTTWRSTPQRLGCCTPRTCQACSPATWSRSTTCASVLRCATSTIVRGCGLSMATGT